MVTTLAQTIRVGRVVVVRDDLVEGGTKRAVLDELLPKWPEPEYVYPSPAQGYAQVALAISAASIGRKAKIFVAARKAWSPETKAAALAGADIVEVEGHARYSVVRYRARIYAQETEGTRLLPAGFDFPLFVGAVARRAAMLGLRPKLVVSAVGTGTLCRGLRLAWPGARFRCVKVGMRPDLGEDRLRRVEVVDAPERFQDPAREPPPFPSASHYDAKAWRFVPNEEGVVFWNVAG
jgi:hypothetical protein